MSLLVVASVSLCALALPSIASPAQDHVLIQRTMKGVTRGKCGSWTDVCPGCSDCKQCSSDPSKWECSGVPTATPTAAPTSVPTLAPTTAPTGVVPPPTPGSKKMIAFLQNWLPCPADSQVANYDELLISFAVTYTWAEPKNDCDVNCNLKPLLICENAPQWDKVRTWQAAGTKVLVSLGGAGMGGSWVGAVNDCWEYCLDKVDHLVSQVKQLVTDHDLDGVDLDYEYLVDGKQYQTFLKDLTVKLKQQMPDKTMSQTPLDWHLDENDAYYNVVKDVGQSIDLLMPQYYNGYIPATVEGVTTGVVPHFRKLVNEVYGGDASRVLHGFCVRDCTSFNVNGQQALQNFKKLEESFPDAGGAFFWGSSDDVGNSWSKYLTAHFRGEEVPDDGGDGGDCSGGCCQCTEPNSCYVSSWGAPCFVPEDGAAACASNNGEWCGPTR